MSSWHTKKLGEVCEYDRRFASDQTLPYLGMEQIEAGTGRIIGDLVPTVTESSSFEFSSEHVLYGRLRPYLNKVALPQVRGRCSTEIFPLKPAPCISREYLFYWLIRPETVSAIDQTSTGARMPRANMNAVAELPVSFPPLAEQKRIVAILDKAFEGIGKATANAERNLANARELFALSLDKLLFGGGNNRSRRFGDTDLLQIIDGDRGTNYPKKSDFAPDGYCLFLSTKNVRPDGFSFDDVVFISKQKDFALRKGKIRKRDVVLTTRGTIGNVALFDDSVPFEHIRINSGMLVLRPNEEAITSEFLFHSLRSALFREQMTRTISGAAQPQLPIRSLVGMEIMVSEDLGEQVVASKKIDELEVLCSQSVAAYERKLVDLIELRQALLHKAFSGQLTGKEAVAA